MGLFWMRGNARKAEAFVTYYRFAYPEKFWKIVNFYYNSRKVWIPGRHMEKLERLLIQQGVKKAFLEQTFSL